MHIKRIIFFYFTFFIISCGGNYSGNEGEIKESLTFQTKSFMAVGDTGSIITSDDGIEWESITSGTAQNLNGIAFGDAIGIVGDGGIIISSTSYTSWRKHHPYYLIYRSIVYGSGKYVIVSYLGDIISTSDWYSWTKASCDTSYYAFYDVAHDNVSNYFLAVGENGIIFKTEDMSSCAQRTSGTSNHLNGVIFLNNQYIIVGNSGTILVSSDGGNTWSSKTSGTSQDLMAILYENNTYVVVGRSGTILISSDGETWLSKTSGISQDLYGIAYGLNTFVAVGMEGVIITSKDTNTWIKRRSGIHFSINDVIYKTD